MRPNFVAATAFVALVACDASREERRASDGRRVLVAFDDAMSRHGAERSAALARLRSLSSNDESANRARDSCVLMLESLAAASELQTRLEPMAAHLEELARADASVPSAERREVLELYSLATRSADSAASAIEPCTRAMDRLRTEGLRR